MRQARALISRGINAMKRFCHYSSRRGIFKADLQNDAHPFVPGSAVLKGFKVPPGEPVDPIGKAAHLGLGVGDEKDGAVALEFQEL